MNRDMIIADAEVAALYLRTLIANGVRPFEASSLTASYVRACVTAVSIAGGMKTERVLEHAETAATYLAALTDKGVGRFDASAFTADYVQSVVFTEATKQKPKEPWEDGESA